TKKPVMVWIHGGAFTVGGTVEPREEGTNFVKENPDVIFVSIEYRLGAFGFLHLSHLPDGKDYPDAQNLGLMDQMMALKWVHENIAGFGGDPDNVTIWGESAGGDSVTTLPLIEGSHKYFKRVIAQSGTPTLSRTIEQSIRDTNEFMEILGCKTVAELQKVDVDKMVLALDELEDMRIGPEKDGKYLPLDPYEAYANGAAKDIDILQGCNKDELNYFVVVNDGIEPFLEFINERMVRNFTVLTDKEKALIESFCKDIKGERYEQLCRLYDQIWFIAPLFRLTENHVKAGGKSYNYYFTVESSVPLMKSGHAVELSTVFNHPEETYVTGRRFDETFSKTMRKMWVQFAKTGNPSLSAEISPDGKAHEWPLYNLKDKEIMVFDEFNIHPEKEADLKLLDWERCYFLTKYFCL
ncbi:MAG: carboxylesterase family protein, partial [Synergistaceae bacterium]|nr:carboxylesterase family protein [Synergistaceae bacterium]